MTGWQGWFYSDPRDPRLLVPRPAGLGMTLNVGHPAARWVLGGTIGAMVVTAVLAAVQVSL